MLSAIPQNIKSNETTPAILWNNQEIREFEKQNLIAVGFSSLDERNIRADEFKNAYNIHLRDMQFPRPCATFEFEGKYYVVLQIRCKEGITDLRTHTYKGTILRPLEEQSHDVKKDTKKRAHEYIPHAA